MASSNGLTNDQAEALRRLAEHDSWAWGCGWTLASPSDMAHLLLSMVEAELVRIDNRVTEDPRDWTYIITDRGRREVER